MRNKDSKETKERGARGCSKNEFQCNDGICISIKKRCDGWNKDCVNGEDEACCAANEIGCPDGSCTTFEEICEGQENCNPHHEDILKNACEKRKSLVEKLAEKMSDLLEDRRKQNEAVVVANTQPEDAPVVRADKDTMAESEAASLKRVQHIKELLKRRLKEE